jgi:aerobic carbon-monoxide dehydrogenase medium subunit
MRHHLTPERREIWYTNIIGVAGAESEEGRVKPAPFTYHRAHSVAETVALLAELGDEAKILAGGLSLVPMMNFRLARPAALVDVSRIEGLSYLRAGQDGLRIGALTTHRTVETCRDPGVLAGFGVLPRAARWIGHYPIRARGTFGGSIAHADPASEWCLLAVLLDARITLAGPAGQRTIAAAEFFRGYYTTEAEPDEMVTEVWFPRPAPRAVLAEFAVRQGDFAIVAAAVSLAVDGGLCREGRVVLGGVGALPVTITPGPLAGQPASAETWQAMGEHAARQIDPPEDTHGSAGYRRRLAATLVQRALAEAAGQ